jgi:hypothetical protein
MRALFLLAFLCGSAVMSEVATADEPKQEPKKAEATEFKFEDIVFNERVRVKQWVGRQKEFLKPVENVWAMRKDVPKKGLVFHIIGTTKPGADLEKNPGLLRLHVEKGSIITDAAGNEYMVTESEGDANVLWVKLTKAAPKNP